MTRRSSVAPAAAACVAAGGMVASSAPAASRIGADILAAGGNAVDAAVASCLALTVADPVNVSLLGRCHGVIVSPGGGALGIDGASEAPAVVRPLGDGPGGKGPPAGHAVAPIPGLLAGLHAAWRLRGRRPWAGLVRPVAQLAEEGFPVPEGLARLWAEAAEALAADGPAARLYLKPDGAPYRAGERYRNPQLSRFLDQVAEAGSDALYRGTAAAVAGESAAGGGTLTQADLEGYRALPGELLRVGYADCEIVTVGRQAWGYTLALMLGLLEAWKRETGASGPIPSEIMALAIHRALADQPQEIATLRPRPDSPAPDGFAYERLLDPAFQVEGARTMGAALAAGPEALRDYLDRWGPVWPTPRPAAEAGDTTHFSVIDDERLTVAMTTSIGPGFGARVASPTVGALFAHSYRMASDPTPGARDRTEMTPAVVLRDGRPIAALGAADNERIPGATLQVLSNLLDGGLPLAEAMAAPRVNWGLGRLRSSAWMPAETRRRLAGLGFPLAPAEGQTARTGVVHAVAVEPGTGRFAGAADPTYDGAAAGPRP